MIVERFVRGDEHRLLVVGGQVVAAARGEAAIGHRRRPLDASRELIDTPAQQRPAPRRRRGLPARRDRLHEPTPSCSSSWSARASTPDSVPPAGQRVLIQRNGNVAFDCHRPGPSRGRRTPPRWPRASSASTSPASTWWPRTSRSPLAGAGRRHRRSQRRPRPADAPEAGHRRSRARWAAPSSTTCSPRRGAAAASRRRRRRHAGTAVIARLVGLLLQPERPARRPGLRRRPVPRPPPRRARRLRQLGSRRSAC